MGRVILTMAEVREMERYWLKMFEIADTFVPFANEIRERMRSSGIADPTDMETADGFQTSYAAMFIHSIETFTNKETRAFVAHHTMRAKRNVPVATDPSYVARAVQDMFTEIRNKLDDEGKTEK